MTSARTIDPRASVPALQQPPPEPLGPPPGSTTSSWPAVMSMSGEHALLP
jgi:hypothetical protein